MRTRRIGFTLLFMAAGLLAAPYTYAQITPELLRDDIADSGYFFGGAMYTAAYASDVQTESRTHVTLPDDIVLCSLETSYLQNGTDPSDDWFFYLVVENNGKTYTSDNLLQYTSIPEYDTPELSFAATTTWSFDPCVIILGNTTTTIYTLGDGTWASGLNIAPLTFSTTTDPYLTLQLHQLRSGSDSYVADTGSTFRWYGTSDFSLFGAFIEPPDLTTLTTDDDFGLLGNFFRDVLQFLFAPSDDAVAYYDDKKDELNEKVPFGYFADLTDELETLEDATSTTGDLTLNVPMDERTGMATQTVTIVDMSNLQDNDDLNTVFGIIKNLFRVALGCVLLAFIWYEITSHVHLD